MEIHNLPTLRHAEKAYVEFLRTANLSAGLYQLPVGGHDTQLPHNEEEIYYVISGRAQFTNGVNDQEIKRGDVIFVDAKEPHKFHDISEPLELLVFFAPPEGSR